MKNNSRPWLQMMLCFVLVSTCPVLGYAQLPDSETTWAIDNAKGWEAYTQGRYSDAQELLLGALKKAERFGPEDPRLAQALHRLGLVYKIRGNYAEAEASYLRALAIREKVLGATHTDVASTLNNLAALYETQGEFTKAEPLYQRALAIREKTLGPNHFDVSTVLNNLAVMYDAQGNYAEAEPLYKRALVIRERIQGPDHPEVATILENYADLLQKTNRAEEAAQLHARTKAIRSKSAPEKSAK